jgi:hypothetical protein
MALLLKEGRSLADTDRHRSPLRNSERSPRQFIGISLQRWLVTSTS